MVVSAPKQNNIGSRNSNCLQWPQKGTTCVITAYGAGLVISYLSNEREREQKQLIQTFLKAFLVDVMSGRKKTLKVTLSSLSEDISSHKIGGFSWKLINAEGMGNHFDCAL